MQATADAVSSPWSRAQVEVAREMLRQNLTLRGASPNVEQLVTSVVVGHVLEALDAMGQLGQANLGQTSGGHAGIVAKVAERRLGGDQIVLEVADLVIDDPGMLGSARGAGASI